MSADKNLSASMEDYLEAIYHIIVEKQAARAKDIAERLHLKSPSVTGALKALSQKGLVNYAPYDLITLTTKGKKVAKDIVHCHRSLRDFLTNILRIDAAEAELNACRIEHTISPQILKRLNQFMKFFDLCSRTEGNWIKAFEYYSANNTLQDDCQRCGEVCSKELIEKKQS